MTDNTTPADWAIEMAMREGAVPLSKKHTLPELLIALARRIERTEQPPLDPLVEEAKRIWRMDHSSWECVLTAIRRGYELGKEAASK